MTYLWILIIIIAIWLFLRWGSKPYIHKNKSQEDLIYSLKELYFRGYDGGYMIIRVPTDKKFKRFVQLSKYIERKGKVGLELGFPLAEWSKPYYNLLKEILNKEGVTFEIEETGEEMVPEFLNIDFKKDVEKAAKICKLIFQKLYGLSQEDCVELFYVRASPKDELIGF